MYEDTVANFQGAVTCYIRTFAWDEERDEKKKAPFLFLRQKPSRSYL